MNVKIAIRNWQSLSKVDLDLVPGINVIVGDNNEGKTACFRAIQSACFNLPHDGIKLGQDKAAVQIITDKAKVTWLRSKTPANGTSKTIYKIDGQEYSKVGRGQFELVADKLGITEIPVLGRKVRLNFWGQKQLPFLMDETPSRIYEFLSMSSEDGNLTDVVRDIRSETSVIAGDSRKVEGAIDALAASMLSDEIFLSRHVGFEDVHKDILALDPDIKLLESLTQSVSKLSRLKGVIKFNKEEKDKLDQVLESTDDMLSLVESEIKSLETLDTALKSLSSKKILIEDSRKSLASIDLDLQRIPDLDSLETEMLEISTLEQQLESLTQKCDKLVRFRQTKDSLVLELNKLNSDLEEVDKLLSAFDTCPLCDSKIG